MDLFFLNEDDEFIEQFLRLYTPLKVIGQGAFSIVFKAMDIRNNREVAIKLLDKHYMGDHFQREVEILSLLQHPNLVRFLESKESARRGYIIMDLVEGVALDQFPMPIPNDQAVYIIKQILSCINYWHGHDIIHRDLKPENIIINKQTLEIKVIDFGLSFRAKSFQTTHTNCGTLIFMAPEMALGKEYFKSVDIWSCGVIQYMLISGKHPFWDTSQGKEQYLERISKPVVNFPMQMNEACISFFQKTVTLHPESRMSAGQALEHPWITGQGELTQPFTMADLVNYFRKKQSLVQVVGIGNIFYSQSKALFLQMYSGQDVKKIQSLKIISTFSLLQKAVQIIIIKNNLIKQEFSFTLQKLWLMKGPIVNFNLQPQKNLNYQSFQNQLNIDLNRNSPSKGPMRDKKSRRASFAEGYMAVEQLYFPKSQQDTDKSYKQQTQFPQINQSQKYQDQSLIKSPTKKISPAKNNLGKTPDSRAVKSSQQKNRFMIKIQKC